MSARRIPMFPLGTVLFPYATLPLHVFERRYRVMIRRCLEGDGEFGVVLIERGSEVGGGDARFDIGTVARVVQASELPDGRYSLLTIGTTRFRVESWLPDDPFPQAEVVALPEPPTDADDTRARDGVVERLGAVLELWQQLEPAAPTELPQIADDAARASFELAAIAPIGPLDAQRALAADSARNRLAIVRDLLDERIADLRARIALDGTE